MASKSGVLYVGITNHLARRIAEHKAGKIPGFTAQYCVKRLLYFEHFESPRDAIAREKEIKSLSRSKKLVLIRTKNPKFADLAEKAHWRTRGVSWVTIATG